MKLKDRKGILIPSKMKPGSWIVLGPPGAGKSHLIQQIGGWPGEVCVDISMEKWWTVEPLTHRPREIHIALPFVGFEQSLPVYDEQWKERGHLPDIDFARIRIPKKKKFILAPNWRAKFVFDFIVPPPEWLFANRKARLSSDDVRLVDMGLTQDWITWQVHTHWRLARFFHDEGLQVLVRPFSTARPFSFPVIRKILRKSTRDCPEELTPELNWSKLRCVKRWVEDISPVEQDADVVPLDPSAGSREPKAPDGAANRPLTGSRVASIAHPPVLRQQLLAVGAGFAAAGRLLSLRK